ncbi:MAG: LysR substrate-binding domain-containing protein [Isosphaerales bacterium]
MPRSVSLSFELLQTFVSLIRHEGEAAAVMRELELNQPTISKRLKYLQHAGPLLDRPWLVRECKTWKLTDEGRKVWPAVEELVDRYQNLHTFVEEGGKPAGATPVHFACGQAMAAGLVRHALLEFRKKHPDARLRISTLRGRARIEGVSNGSLDLAIVRHDEPSILEIARRPLHIEPLVTYRLALVCASGTKWESKLRSLPKGGVPPEVFCSFPLILPEPDAGIRKGLDEVLRSRGLLNKLDIALEIGGWATILAYVRDGFGVGVVNEGDLTDSEGVTLRKLDPGSFDPIVARLICRRATGPGEEPDLNEPTRAWYDELRRLAREHKPLGR